MELKKKFTEAVDFEQKQENRKVTAESSLQQKVKYGVLGDISNESEKDIVKSMSSKADLSSTSKKSECTENINLNSLKIRRAHNNGKIMHTVLERHGESTVKQFIARHKTGLGKETLSGMFTFFKTIMKHNAVWLLKNIQSTTKSYLVHRACSSSRRRYTRFRT